MDNNNNKSSSRSSSSTNGRPSLTSSGSVEAVEAVKVNDSSLHQQQQSSELENLVRRATELECEDMISAIIQNQDLTEEAKIKMLRGPIAHVEAILRKQVEAEKTLLRRVEQAEEDKEKFRRQAEAERRQAEAERKKNKTLLPSTILETYLTKEGTFQLPPLKYNRRVEPSTGGHNWTVNIKDKKGKKIKVELQIPEAEIITDGGGSWMNPSDVTIRTEFQDGGLIPSALGVAWAPYNNQALEYANELGIQKFCNCIVDDALNALGLLIGSVMSHQEISIYTLKPDIVLVLKFEGRLMFVIEVKSPDPDGKDDVFDSKHVSGQVSSYLWAMRAAGSEVPMGAIMTYDKIALVTLDDLSKNDDHQEILAKTRMELSTGSPIDYHPTNENQKCDEPRLSPTKTSKELLKIDMHNVKTKTISQCNDSKYNNNQVTVLEQNVYRSKVYKEGEVFPCLLQAFHVAFQHATLDKESKPITCVHPGYEIGGRTAFELGESSFKWVQLNLKATTKSDGALVANIVKKVPNSRTKYIALLAKIGSGSTAATYVATTRGGKVFAVKDYYLSPSSALTDNERAEEEDERRFELYDIAEGEQRRWQELYKGRFTTRVATLGAKPCLLMPYGHEIFGDANNRWLAVPAVRRELEIFAEKRYFYNRHDLRWRHVLLFKTTLPEKEVFLCDLGSLNKMEKTDNASEHVYKQLLSLLKVASPEQPNLIETLAWAKSQLDDVKSVVNGTETLKQFFDGLTDDKSIQNSLKSLFPQDSETSNLSSKGETTLYMLAHFKGLVVSNSESKRPPTASPQSETTIRNTMEQDDNGDQHKRLKTAP